MITEKNKEQFEKWLSNGRWFDTIPIKLGFTRFSNLPFEMQIGVYLAYYDSVGIYVNAMSYEKGNYWLGNANYETTRGNPTRNEAYKESFKKANELINNQLD